MNDYEADAGEKAEVISVTLAELTEANVARIAIKVATAEGAVVGDSGTITVRVTGAALANTSETVTAEGGIAYTVKAVQTAPDFLTKTDDTTANNAATLGLSWIGALPAWSALPAAGVLAALVAVMLRRTVWCGHKDFDVVDITLGCVTMAVLGFYFMVQLL